MIGAKRSLNFSKIYFARELEGPHIENSEITNERLKINELKIEEVLIKRESNPAAVPSKFSA
jgi:hypothetical protein